MKITLCLMMGLPAAGKSTLLRCLRNHIEHYANDVHVCVVDYDKIIPNNLQFAEGLEKSSTVSYHEKLQATELGISDREDAESRISESTVWKSYRTSVYNLLQLIVLNLRNPSSDGATKLIEADEKLCRLNDCQDLCSCFYGAGISVGKLMQSPTKELHHIIFLDDNMFYRSMRYSIFQLARRNECSYCQIFIDRDIDTLIERNRCRDERVSNETIYKMAGLIENPNPIRNKWEVNTYVVKDNVKNDELLEFIRVCSHYPYKPEEDKSEVRVLDRKQCYESFVHQIDQVVRKYISKEIKLKKDTSSVKSLAQLFNKAKKLFLDEVRHNDLHDNAMLEIIFEEFKSVKYGEEAREKEEISQSWIRDVETMFANFIKYRVA